MNMPEILQWLTGAIVIATFLGTAVVFLRGSKDKGTIETLERSNAALTARVVLLEGEDARNGERIKALEQANKVLQNTANSSAEIAELRTVFLEAIQGHHTQAMTGMDRLHDDLTDIGEKLGGTQ